MEGFWYLYPVAGYVNFGTISFFFSTQNLQGRRYHLVLVTIWFPSAGYHYFHFLPVSIYVGKYQVKSTFYLPDNNSIMKKGTMYF